MSAVRWDTFSTPFGSMLATADDLGLRCLMRHTARSAGRVPTGNQERDQGAFRELRRQLEAYFEGELQEFELRLNPQGTEFQRRVWTEVQKVPWGRTATYIDIARRIGNVDAIRAVGSANGANPIHIIIPCHRIIGKDGSLRGYAGGLEMKRRLLELEGHNLGGRQSGLFD